MKKLIYLIIFILISSVSNCQSNSNSKSIVIDKEIIGLKYSEEYSGSIQGYFILGYGFIDGNLSNNKYYYFYRKTSVGLILDKLPADRVHLIETDNISPRIRIIYSDVKMVKATPFDTNPSIYKVLTIGSCGCLNPKYHTVGDYTDLYNIAWGVIDNQYNYIQIIVPKGTIIENYSGY